MKIPAPPLYAPSMHSAVDGGTADQVSSADDEPIKGKEESAYHGYYNNSPRNSKKNINNTTEANGIPMQQYTMPQSSMVYDTSYDQQHTDRIEEQHDQTYNRHLEEQSYEEHSKIYRENVDLSASSADALATTPLATPATSIKEKILPNVLSIAQKLLPTVMKRLDQHDQRLLHKSSIDYKDDDFAGICSPLGSPMSSPQKTTLNVGNLKTTGETESDYYRNNDSLLVAYQQSRSMMGRAKTDEDTIDDEVEDIERGESIEEILEEEDPTKYLPQSAALLVSALQGSSFKKHSRSNSNLKDGGDFSSAYQEECSIRRSNTLEMETKEQEADALLESIRKDDYYNGRGVGSGRNSQQRDEEDELAAVVSSSIAAAIGYDDIDDDDDGSISGDMAQLTRSIAHLQRDLENLDFSHLDGMLYDDGFGDVGGGSDLDGYYDGENTLLSRMKLWFSRGSIMEQKLLNTYVNPMQDDNDGGSTTDNRGSMGSSGRYSDNPVLVWSLSLMWAFVVLLLMHPKIAELIGNGDDPGQLADIIEWLFG